MSAQLFTTSPAKGYNTAARIGLLSKGVVYSLTGIIALLAALNLGNNDAGDAGKEGVFGFIENQPFGKWMMLAIALGLACYTFWRWMQAFKDTEHKGSDKKAFAKRFAYFFSGLVYAGLALYCFKVFLGSSSNDNSEQGWVAALLQKPYGQWLVAIVAAIIIGTGLYQLYRAFSGKYKKYVRSALHKDAGPWIISVGMAGYIARGIVWLIIGWLFIKAAMNANAKEAGGSDAAFQWLQEASYGTVLLAVVAMGLICYGLFMFLRARYQAIHLH